MQEIPWRLYFYQAHRPVVAPLPCIRCGRRPVLSFLDSGGARIDRAYVESRMRPGEDLRAWLDSELDSVAACAEARCPVCGLAARSSSPRVRGARRRMVRAIGAWNTMEGSRRP